MIYIENDELIIQFPELHPNAGVTIDFQRTLRLPDDGKTYPLPPGLGSFPLRHIEDYDLGHQNAIKKRGGIIMPMFQADALWLNFNSIIQDAAALEYPLAIKIGAGKVCAISGEQWCSQLNQHPQDYLVVPEQPWLDGFNVADGTIRQFVADPLGNRATVEEQITGTSEIGGIQIEIYPMKKSYFDSLHKVSSTQIELNNKLIFNLEMGLSAGGKMHQEIYDDPYDFSAWDLRNSQRVFITLANAEQWMTVTGEEPPLKSITAEEYNKAGLPWFDYYDRDKAAIEGAKALGKIKSFQAVYLEKGQSNWSEETISGEPTVLSTMKRAVKMGNW